MASRYEIVSVNRVGADAVTHGQAVISERPRWELNRPGSFSFDIPAGDPTLSWLTPVQREVQLWKDNTLIFWGPIVRRTIKDLEVATVEVSGLLWYFDQLHIGKAGRTNWLVNGSFDTANLAGWSAVGVTANLVDQWGPAPGRKYQLNLDQQGSLRGEAPLGQDTYLQQMVRVPGGVFWTLSAFYHIRLDTTWHHSAFDDRGLFVERRDPATNNLEEVQFAQITNDTPRDGLFHRLTLGIHTPPGRDSLLWVRLYAPHHHNPTPVPPRPPGGIIWDNVTLTAMESLSFTQGDLGLVINELVTHAQSAAYGKLNLNIAGVVPNLGIYMTKAFQHVEHANIGSVLKELTEQGLCDIDIEWDANGLSRFMRAWHPRRGTVRSDIVLELGAAGGIIAVPTIEVDASRTKTSIIVKGSGSGPETDEAWAADATYTGGVILEEIVTPATENLHYDLLQGYADTYLTARRRLVETPEVVVSSELFGRIQLGDTLRMIIDPLGPESVDEFYRVVAMELDPETDETALVLNAT